MNIRQFIICVVCVISCCVASMAQPSYDWQELLVKPGCFSPLPKAGDSFWQDSVSENIRNSYIRYGEQYFGKQWMVLPFTVFAEFKTNGNRTRYEAMNFAKRKQMAALVMAEIIEGKGRFVNDIVNGIGSFCEETWWGIPAHYGKKYPVADEQNVDLFNAETAGLIAWTRYMLEHQLETFAPGFCRHIDAEIDRRMLRPAATTDYWWKKASMNWNPWICSNWLACVLICEKDRDRQIEGIRQIVEALGTFIDSYPDDGGCDEGTGYWDRAAASLYECIRLLRHATDGKVDLLTPKVHEMMNYICKMYIGDGYCVNFADAHNNRMQVQPNILFPMALDIDDVVMKGLAAQIAEETNLFTEPSVLYDHSGNFPALGRELFMLRNITAAIDTEAKEPQIKDTWLSDLQIMTVRRGNFYVAMKGGTNGESHNHNDVGNFIVYANNIPLIIDAGVGEYTSATFSKDRYTIWTMQSAYHNLPMINGVQQKDGRQYSAKVIDRRKGMLTLDITEAYPDEAAVKSWKRTMKLNGKCVEIIEDYELLEYREPARMMLMTVVEPVVTVPGYVALGNHGIEFDAAQIEPVIEEISDKMDVLLHEVWGPRMFRIVLTVKSDGLTEKVKYRIR